MMDSPRQDWCAYEASTRQENANWVRNLSPLDRFAIYDDLFNLIWSARGDAGNWSRLEQWNWKQKVAARLKLVSAFTSLDQFRCERAASKNSD